MNQPKILLDNTSYLYKTCKWPDAVSNSADFMALAMGKAHKFCLLKGNPEIVAHIIYGDYFLVTTFLVDANKAGFQFFLIHYSSNASNLSA